MTKRWRVIDLLLSPQVKKDMGIIIALEVAVAITKRNIVGEEGTFLCYLVLHLQALHLPHQGAQDPLPQILAHPLQ